MAIKKRRIKIDADIPDSSMADIAFLLLIFFMVTTSFFNERGLPIMLPGDDTGAARIPRRNLCRIFINSLGDMYVDDQPMTISTLGGYVRARMEQNPNLVVVIRTDENARYEWMLQVFDEMRKIDMRRVSLQVNRRR